MFRELLLAAIVITSVVCGYASGSTAQVIEVGLAAAKVGETALLGKAVKDIIDSARLAASGLIAEGRNTGNALITRAGDELNVSIENAVRVLGADFNRKFDRLEEEERKILLGIARATEAVTDISKRAYLAKETLALDMRSILGGFPLTSEVFVIQRVSGLTQLQKEAGGYEMQLVASYAGTPASGYSTSISLSLNGKKVDDLRIDPVELHVAKLTIPKEQLSNLFLPDAISIVEAELTVEYIHPESFLLFFSSDKRETISTKLHLVLYPFYAGEIGMMLTGVQYDWRDIAPDSKEETGPNAHCSSKCNGHHGIKWSFEKSVSGGNTPPLEGDKRIVAATCYPIPGHNGFDADIGTSILNKATTAKCNVRARSHPATYRLEFSIQQWGLSRDVIETRTVKLYFGRIAEFRTPKNIKTIRISGQLLTGESFDILLDEPNASNPIEFIRSVENTDDRSYFIRPLRPAGFD